MTSYKELYFHLFAAIADATEDLERGRIIPACDRLVNALRDAEAAHLETDILPEQ